MQSSTRTAKSQEPDRLEFPGSVGVDSQTETASLIRAMDQHATVAVTDTEGRILYVNDKFCSISGYSASELLGKNPRVVNSGYHSPEFFQKMWTTIKRGEVWHGEFRNKTRAGNYYWTKTTIVPVLSKNGKVIRFIAILTEITNQVLAQDRLSEMNHTLEAIIQASPVAIMGIDAKKNIVIWNPAAERIFQLPVSQCLNHPLPRNLLMNEESFDSLSKQVNSGETVLDLQLAVNHPHQNILELSVSAAPLKQANGDRSGMVLVINDVTERKRMENEILEISERERSRVGHDLHDGLGQNLLAIGLNCKLLEEKLLRLNLPEAEQVGNIASSVRQAISLTRNLARGLSPLTLAEEGIISVLEQHTEHVSEASQIDCRFKAPGSQSPLGVETDTHLFRIAQEAISNAIQHSQCDLILVELSQDPNHCILKIKDNGKGYRPKKKSKGMGNHIMQYRTRLLRGDIQIQSEPSGGTEVVCRVPVRTEYEPKKGRTT
jgi:two-component system, NarL family, sensor histidine kinase NreB